MQLDNLYQEIILDHYKKPRGRGLREPFSAEVHHVNPTCGDEVDLRVLLACSISQASASVLYEVMAGKTVHEALSRVDAFTEMIASRGEITGDEEVLEDGVAFAGVAKYPARVKCALLSWMAFKDATAQAVAKEEVTP